MSNNSSKSNHASILVGGCSCAAVRYTATGKPTKVCYCHCDSCRKSTGAPASVPVMFKQRHFRFTTGNPRFYESSPGVKRGFCSHCGTPLSWSGIWHGEAFTFVYLGTLDNPELVSPDRHAFYKYKIGWFETSDCFLKYDESSPLDGLAVGDSYPLIVEI